MMVHDDNADGLGVSIGMGRQNSMGTRTRISWSGHSLDGNETDRSITSMDGPGGIVYFYIFSLVVSR